MDFYGRVEGGEFAGVGREVCGGEVADVDGAGAVVGVLVGGRAADAEGGVGARDDDHFSFDSTTTGAPGCDISGVRSLLGVVNREVGGAYGPVESPAMRRILGMSSKVPGSGGLTTSCSLRARRRVLELDVMLGFARALMSRRSSSDGIVVVVGIEIRRCGEMVAWRRATDHYGKL